MGRASTFADIYRTNAWNGVNGSRSGPGSTFEATERLRQVLPLWFSLFEITSVLDAGCGDGGWMPDLPGYIGCDVVPDAVDRMQAVHPYRSYITADIVSDDLPKVDAVIVRDVFQHLSYADIRSSMFNLSATGARFIMANTHRGEDNSDIESGGFFPINLESPPFSWGPPLAEIIDGYWASGLRYPGKVFGLWRL